MKFYRQLIEFWTTSARDIVLETPVMSLRRDRKQRPSDPDSSHDFYIIESVSSVRVANNEVRLSYRMIRARP